MESIIGWYAMLNFDDVLFIANILPRCQGKVVFHAKC